MAYDRRVLENWRNMEDWAAYLDRNGGLTTNTSREGFDFLQKEYFSEVKRRIDYCKKLAGEREDPFLNYTIAELYDRYDLDKSQVYLYKKPVRYYALRALELDPGFIPAKELLKRTDEWMDFLDDKTA